MRGFGIEWLGFKNSRGLNRNIFKDLGEIEFWVVSDLKKMREKKRSELWGGVE